MSGNQPVINPDKFTIKEKSGDFFRRTYFLGYKVQKAKIGGWRKSTFYYRKLRCQPCRRTFRTEFGYESHLESEHPGSSAKKPSKYALKKRKAAAPGKRGSIPRLKKPKKFKNEEDIVQLTDSEEDILEAKSYIPDKKDTKPNRKTHSKPIIITFDKETADELARDPDFNPKVELRDVYLFEETSYDLPDKPALIPPEPESKKDYVRRIRQKSGSSKSPKPSHMVQVKAEKQEIEEITLD